MNLLDQLNNKKLTLAHLRIDALLKEYDLLDIYIMLEQRAQEKAKLCEKAT